jgi:pSer/pThr/pTyr-binding forkhead associated (FHA) protein
MAQDASDDLTPLPNVTLHVARGRSSTTSREMKGRSLLLGSGPQCDIQMRSSDVAAKHALITRGADGVVLRPLDADHPVHVNGSPVHEYLLQNGDSIKLGPFELRVTIQEQVDRPASQPSKTPGGGSAWQSLAKLTRRPTTEATPESPAPLLPERLAEIQRAQAETDRDLERRRRQLQEELAKIESERAHFKQEKARFDHHRQEVDRQLRDSAAREGDLARLAKDLEDRERRIVEREQQLDTKQNTIADESIAFDHRLERFEASKLKLLRVRRRLMEQYRLRWTQCAGVSQDVAQREAKLRQERTEHEAEVTHWKRVADELGRKQAELKRIEAEIARRNDLTDRREQELKERQARFESEIAQTHSKDKTLESLRADLERRKGLLAEEEASLREARRAVEEQFERAKVRSSEIHRRHDEVEARRLTTEKQEEYLREQAAALEKHRVALVELDRDLATRQAHLDQAESALVASRQHLETREGDLRIRELSLTQSQELLASKEATLREWESQKQIDQRAIDRRLADLQKQSESIAQQIEVERRQLEDKRQESESLFEASVRAKDEVEDERDRWLAKMNEAREMSAEVAHRESIVQARQRQIDSVQQYHHQLTGEIESRQQALENDRRLLDMDRTKLDQESQEARHRAQVIQAEVDRLRELSLELERRQQDLLARESYWSREVNQRKADWQHAADDLASRQTLLDRQAASQKQRVQKLKDLTSKLFGRSPRVEQKADQVRTHHEAQVDQIQSAQLSHKETLERLLREVDQMEQHSTASSESMRQLQAELERLAQIRDQVDRSMKGAATLGEQELLSLDRWSGELEKGLAAIEARSLQLDADRERLAQQTPLSPTLPVPASTLETRPAPARDPWSDILRINDEELMRALTAASFLDASKLQWLKQSAHSRGCRLVEEVVRSRTATLFQLGQILAGKSDQLHLGSLTILDEIHHGAVADTYLVTGKGSDRPWAARMLRPMWSRDPARRRQYEIVLDSLRSFSHPNVVPIRGSLLAGERFGAVMDFVPSVSLDQMTGLPVPAGAVASICHQALLAISFAERAGIAHLSLRPSRVLLSTGGQVQLLGFGEPDWLRRMHWCERGRSMQPYASPEVLLAGESADTRADVFSIAAIVGELILASSGASSLADPSLREEYSPALLDLLDSMCDPQADKRPRAHEAVGVLEGMADLQSLIDWPDLAIRLEQSDRLREGRLAA